MISDTGKFQIQDEKDLKESKFHLISIPEECFKIVEEILIHQKIIALDCEGIYLSREGKLTLIQISLLDERVFIFDILKGGQSMLIGSENFKGLKHILENKKILKLIHDCRNDWDSLLHQFSVRLYNFVDTQEAFFVFKLFHYQEITLPISLMNFIESMLKIKLKYKEKFKSDINSDPFLWEKRPIDVSNLNYAAEDVIYLIRAWVELREKFNPNMKEIVYFLTIIKVVDIPMFHQFREYLITNIVYLNMLDNVFDTKEILNYIFSIDYIYNFLQIKLICNEETDIKSNLKIRFNDEIKKDVKNMEFINTKQYFFDQDYKNLFKSEETSLSLVRLGMDFKKKQKLNYFNFNNKDNIFSKNSLQGKSGNPNREIYFPNYQNNINGGIPKRRKFNKQFNKFGNLDKDELTNLENVNENININNTTYSNTENSKSKNDCIFEKLFDQNNSELNKTTNNVFSSEEKAKKLLENFYINFDNSRSNSYDKLKANSEKNLDNKGIFKNNEKNQNETNYLTENSTKNDSNESKRKISNHFSSFRKLSNISNISNDNHSDSEKNLTFFNENNQFSYDDNSIEKEKQLNLSLNRNSRLNSEDKSIQLKKDKYNYLKEEHENKAKTTSKSQKQLLNYKRIFQKLLYFSTKQSKIMSNENLNTIDEIKNEKAKGKIQMDAIKFEKNEIEIIRNVIKIDDYSDLNGNDFNKSLYDNDNLPTKKSEFNSIKSKRKVNYWKNHHILQDNYYNGRNYNYYSYYHNKGYFQQYQYNYFPHKNSKNYNNYYLKTNNPLKYKKRNTWNEAKSKKDSTLLINDTLIDSGNRENTIRSHSPEISKINHFRDQNNQEDLKYESKYLKKIEMNKTRIKKKNNCYKKDFYNQLENQENYKNKNPNPNYYEKSTDTLQNQINNEAILKTIEKKENFNNKTLKELEKDKFKFCKEIQENSNEIHLQEEKINFSNEKEKFYVNNNFNININKDNFIIHKIVLEDELNNHSNQDNTKRVIYFEHDSIEKEKNSNQNIQSISGKNLNEQEKKTYENTIKNKTEKIDINIEIDKTAICSNTTNINNYFNIILNNSSTETKNFKLEININERNKRKFKTPFQKKKLKNNKCNEIFQECMNYVNKESKDLKYYNNDEKKNDLLNKFI